MQKAVLHNRCLLDLDTPSIPVQLLTFECRKNETGKEKNNQKEHNGSAGNAKNKSYRRNAKR